MAERGRLVLAGCPPERLEQFSTIARQLSCEFYSCHNLEDLLAFTQGAGCIIADLLVGSVNLLDLLPQLIQDRPTFKVLVFSTNADVSTAVRVMKAGAFNVLTPQSGATALMLSIHEALIAAADAESQVRRDEELLAVIREFSPGEMAVLRLVLTGLINRDIAERLRISPRTVELRRQKILHATKAANAVRLAYVISRSPRVWQVVNEAPAEDLHDADTVPEMNVPNDLVQD